jgi:hypothetical protein
MRTQSIESRWEHAHECQACGYAVGIDDIDANVITSGIVTCRRCDASGPVNVKILDAQQISESTQPLRGKGQ